MTLSFWIQWNGNLKSKYNLGPIITTVNGVDILIGVASMSHCSTLPNQPGSKFNIGH